MSKQVLASLFSWLALLIFKSKVMAMIIQSIENTNKFIQLWAIALLANLILSQPLRGSTCSINDPVCTSGVNGEAFKNPYYTKDIVPHWYEGATIEQLGIYAYGSYYIVTHKSLQPNRQEEDLTFEQVTDGHNAQSKKALSFLLQEHPEDYWFRLKNNSINQ